MFNRKFCFKSSPYFAIVSISILLLLAPQSVAANTNTHASASEESDQRINDFSLAGYGERGRKAWEISGKSADIFRDLVKLKDIVGNLYNEQEKIKLTADQGDFNKESGVVHLERNVVVTSSTGARLTTDSLHWDRENQLMSTKDKVNIERQDMHLAAWGASGRPDLNEVVLEKDVRMNILATDRSFLHPGKAEEEVVITCDGPLVIDYQKNVAVFNNNVKVDRESLQIDSDIMEVYFYASANKTQDLSSQENSSMPLGGKIDRIVARHNVKITRGENVSYSDEAIYSALDKKIMLSGNPKLVIYSKESKSAPFGN